MTNLGNADSELNKTLFYVSNMGKIRMLNGIVTTGCLQKGYKLYGPQVGVHQAVCFKFHGPPPSTKHSPNHLDNDPLNNRATNLAWATPKEQSRHSFATNKNRLSSGPAQSKCVEMSPRCGKEVWTMYESVVAAAAATGHSREIISKVCRGLKPYTKKFKFRFVEEPVLLEEDWREIIFNDNKTGSFISNLGRVKTQRGIISFGSLTPGGYCRITIHGKNHPVHVLVARAFLQNPHQKKTVDHINQVPSDNRVENLRYATSKEQKENQRRVVQNSCPVEARQVGEENFVLFNSARDAGEILNISPNYIRNCCGGHAKSAKGYEFRYAIDEDLPGEIWMEFTEKDLLLVNKRKRKQKIVVKEKDVVKQVLFDGFKQETDADTVQQPFKKRRT